MARAKKEAQSSVSGDLLWYKDAIIYQLHVKGFYDSNGDGIGDFKGVQEKLDYLKELGVNAIWVQPFYPSPQKDDGYDISDYEHINSNYGDLADFKAFLKGAHERGIRVITELVINHTSDQHEWFQKSRRAAPDSYWRNFYVWTDNPQKYKEVRIIFKDFETSNWTWDPVAKAYFWHRFYSHQPDLNFDNPEVQKQIFRLLDYWMKMGVDGLRLDAIPYLFERDGTSCENLPETHAFLKTLRAHMDKHYPGRMLLAEANMWPDDAAAYFGDGDECHMNFHFPVMPRLFMSLKMEDRYSIIDILKQTPEIPPNCQWAMFLRNHDELTLEMVTDEERDYMYKVYATDTRARINLGIRRRLAPLLGNDRRQIELLNGLLFSFPGTPIIYYGDEIGMGDNIYLGDRNGVRTPMQWTSDRNAGFSNGDPQKLYLPVIMTPEYHYTTLNVENQMASPNSQLNWMKKLIELRKENIALTRGTMTFLEPPNQKVLAFVREYEDKETGESQRILVLANLSKKAQYCELDLSAYRGMVPTELRGDTAFPSIGELPYFITLGAYDFYWFSLSNAEKLDKTQWLLRDQRGSRIPARPRSEMSEGELIQYFERMLADYLPKARWFAGKGQQIRHVRVRDRIEVEHHESPNHSSLLLVEVQYKDDKDTDEMYLVTIARAENDRAENILRDRPDLVIGEYVPASDRADKGIYHEAIIDPGFAKAMLLAILRRKDIEGTTGTLSAETYMPIKREWMHTVPDPLLSGLEQSNTSLRFGKSFFFKLFRKLEEGINPELEIGEHISRSDFHGAPRMIGSLTYNSGGRVYALAVLHEQVEAVSGAWELFQKHIEDFAEIAATNNPIPARKLLVDSPSFFEMRQDSLPAWFVEHTDHTGSLMHLLGQRTAELHKMLASGEEADFRPEDITPFYQRSFYQSLRNRAAKTHLLLQKEDKRLPKDAKPVKDKLFKEWQIVEDQFLGVKNKPAFGGKRIRIHGDYHLGQVLFTGKDFSILDFEGEPMRALSARRLKHSPLQDVAGMLRSIDYATAFYTRQKLTKEADREKLGAWLKLWRLWMSHQFFRGYFETCKGTDLLPPDEENIRYLTEVLLLEKALYEIGYELGSRPDWVFIPLCGTVDMLPTLTAAQGKDT
jgi:maltose alpha-D-glucosyltransferase/alpha-amylase